MEPSEVKALEYVDGALWILDQRRLPHEITWLECRDYVPVADAIRTLAVRGAPAIGLAAAYGASLSAASLTSQGFSGAAFEHRLQASMTELAATRPTAVNLFWALARIRRVVDRCGCERPRQLGEALLEEANHMMMEDRLANEAMSMCGAALIPANSNILTHCNTGALVSSSLGTALGAIRVAHEQGKQIHVWVDETRPLLQGARLTTWELQRLGVPFTLITDSMAAHFMARGRIQLVMVGADRIAANGDTANKIGTYSVAVLAHAHDLPFYVVAPTSTLDLSLDSGASIKIEERDSREVTAFASVKVAPDGVDAANPAFDVTPARLISAIVTEVGVARHPFQDALSSAAATLSVAARYG